MLAAVLRISIGLSNDRFTASATATASASTSAVSSTFAFPCYPLFSFGDLMHQLFTYLNSNADTSATITTSATTAASDAEVTLTTAYVFLSLSL